MKFFTAITALLATSVAAAPTLVQRDEKSIVAAITTIQNSVVTLNNSVNAFQPVGFSTISQLLQIQQQTGDVASAIQSAIKTVDASQNLSQADSLTVGLAVLDFAPMVFSLLTNLVANKTPKFDDVEEIFSVRKTVLAALQKQETLSGQLGQAITSKIDPSFDSLAANINAQIKSNFDKAVAAYEVPSGKIELPPIPSF